MQKLNILKRYEIEKLEQLKYKMEIEDVANDQRTKPRSDRSNQNI